MKKSKRPITPWKETLKMVQET